MRADRFNFTLIWGAKMRAKATYYATAPGVVPGSLCDECRYLARFSSMRDLRRFIAAGKGRWRISWQDARRFFPALNRGAGSCVWVEFPKVAGEYLAKDSVTKEPVPAKERA